MLGNSVASLTTAKGAAIITLVSICPYGQQEAVPATTLPVEQSGKYVSVGALATVVG